MYQFRTPFFEFIAKIKII